MACFWDKDDGGKTKKAMLSFKRDQLLYDIKNYAYIEGSLLTDAPPHVRHTVQDVGEEGNVDRVTRVLNLSVCKCREMLYPYTKREITKAVLDDRLKEVKVYGIALDLPATFSQTSLFLLEKLVHEYLVCTALADWLSITHAEKAKTWQEKAGAAETEAKNLLRSRMNRLRRKKHWV